VSERRDYDITLTIVAPQLTEDGANQMIDGLKAYVDAHIAPITGDWILDSHRSILDSDFHGGWPITTRKAWTCERCNKVQAKGTTAIEQRYSRVKRRICEACAA
jgi:hypothetical protein